MVSSEDREMYAFQAGTDYSCRYMTAKKFLDMARARCDTDLVRAQRNLEVVRHFLTAIEGYRRFFSETNAEAVETLRKDLEETERKLSQLEKLTG